MNRVVDSLLFKSDVINIDSKKALFLGQVESLYVNCGKPYSPVIGQANYILCDYYYSLGNFQIADSLVDHNLEFLKNTPELDTILFYRCQSLKAGILIGLEKIDFALEILNELMEKTKDDAGEKIKKTRVGVLNRIGMANRRIRRFDKALASYQEMQNLAETIYSSENSIFRQILGNIAGIYSAQGEYEQAITINKKILADLDTLINVDPLQKARIQYNLGFQYHQMFRYSAAIDNYTNSINTRVLGGVNQTRHQAIALQSRAICYGSIQSYKEAKSDLDEASSILFLMSSEDEIQSISMLLTNIQLQQGMEITTGSLDIFTRVRPLLDTILADAKEGSAYLISGLCNQAGVICNDFGKAEDSKYYYQQALQLQEKYGALPKDVANTCGNIASSCVQTGEYQEGYRYANRSLVLSMPSTSVVYYIYTGTPQFLYTLRHSARLAMGIYDQQHDRVTLLQEWKRMLFGLDVLDAFCQYSANYSKDFLSFMSAELLPLAAEMAWRLADNKEEEQYYYGRIIEFSERNKHYFGYLEVQTIANSKGFFSPKERQLRNAVKAQYIAWQELENSSKYDAVAIAEASEDYLSLKDSLNQYQQTQHLDRSYSYAPANEFSTSDLQSLMLIKEEALLGYLATSDNIFVTLVKPSEYKVKRIPKTAELLAAINQLQESLVNEANDGPADKAEVYSDAAYALYRYLLEPIIKDLPPRFVVSYDPGLGGILPFDILLTEPINSTKKSQPNQFPYLIRDYTVSYALNGIMYYRSYQPVDFNRIAEHSLIMAPLGTISFDDKRPNGMGFFDAIPESIIECESVSRILQARYIKGNQATETFFLANAPQAPIIHLATHGVYNPGQPSLSGVLFAPIADSVENEIFYLPEVYDLPLQASLISLSACETNIGRVVKGEGALSISRAFLVAGAHSVVATQWPIRADSSATIITSFYENLLSGVDKAESLRLAKLDYLKTASGFKGHPYYWAGSVLTGHAGKL